MDGTVPAEGAAPAAGGETPLADVEAELCTLAGRIAAATSRFLALLADFDAREGWAGAGVRSCAHWLSWRCGLDLRTAREHVRVARALRGLPRTAEAFAAGRISYSKARAIARVGTPGSDADLVHAALHAPAAHLERLTRGLAVAGAAPKGVEPALPTPFADPSDEPERARLRIHHRWAEDGTLLVWGRLSAEDGALLLAAATRADAQVRRTAPRSTPADGPAGPEETPPPSAPDTLVTRPPHDLAAALVAMAGTTLTNVDAPVHAPAADVVVHVPAGALAGGELSGDTNVAAGPSSLQGARLDDGPGLPRQVLDRLVCDARIQLSVDGPDGRALDLGRRTRRPTTRQLAVLWRRDHGCVVPGCGRLRFLHAHHVVPWARGGPTSVNNLVLLCGDHHRALHGGKLAVEALGRQHFRVLDRHGSEIPTAPPTSGEAAALAAEHADVTAETIEPDWDGSPLDLPWATVGYLSAWAS